ncbi:HPr family phosphocarrier protein [Candidatus Margulisiibacteriota bacterium]
MGPAPPVRGSGCPSRAKKIISLQNFFIPALAGAKLLRPTPMKYVDPVIRRLSYVMPLHISAVERPLAVANLNVPVRMNGREKELSVMFSDPYDFRGIHDDAEHLKLLAAGKWWKIDVFWPVSRGNVVVLWKEGLHERPTEGVRNRSYEFISQIILSTALSSEVINDPERKLGILRGQEDAQAEGILKILTLGAICGDRVAIQAKGPDHKEALKAMEEVFKETREGW